MSVKYRQLVLIGCNCVGQRERERRVVDFGAKEGPEVYDVHGNMRETLPAALCFHLSGQTNNH